MPIYVQYGCGLCAPSSWVNFDASPTLRLQKIPVFSWISRKKVDFPPNVRYGNILTRLPGIQSGSCDAVFCSHTLEHLSLMDFYLALQNTFELLKDGGIFRCVLPDLEHSMIQYFEEKKNNPDASLLFMRSTMLGVEKRTSNIKDFIINYFGNSSHLWMWDQYSLEKALKDVGFSSVRKCDFGDSDEKAFCDVEDESRFRGSIAFECVK